MSDKFQRFIAMRLIADDKPLINNALVKSEMVVN